ncbi:GL26403 [Drosophila persimilis]|uniref:GL26403 n=1 Tax=Drosophila persimilis TaxID=7234 RepID=B4GSX1_DROPE|nr:GL26403 [Drosophila persimilis]
MYGQRFVINPPPSPLETEPESGHIWELEVEVELETETESESTTCALRNGIMCSGRRVRQMFSKLIRLRAKRDAEQFPLNDDVDDALSAPFPQPLDRG